jgi:hypothetical protein
VCVFLVWAASSNSGQQKAIFDNLRLRHVALPSLGPPQQAMLNGLGIPTYLNLQEILRDPVYLLETLRVRVRACAREACGHELLRLALALLLLLGLRLLRRVGARRGLLL